MGNIENFFPDVTIPVKDAVCIVLFVVISSLCIRYLSMMEAKRLNKKINMQHLLVDTIVNNAPFIMCLKDTNGKILHGNKELLRILDSNSDNLFGLNSYELFDDASISIEEDKSIINTKHCLKTERLVKFKNMPAGWYKVIKAPVLDDNGDVINIIVSFQNIDTEKQLEERKDTFVATMTHDLKTPTLAQIRTLDLLLKGSFGTLTEEQREITSQIKNSCNYMSGLIFTILDTYLYDNGQTKIHYDDFSFPELVKETVSEISNILTEKEQEIIIDTTVNTGIVSGDEIQLKRVIINLLSNAIAYGFAKSTIYISIVQDENTISFNVKNKAKYIPVEKLSDVYEKFSTSTDAKFRKTGMGLGLYLSKQIIDAHNGQIYASSTKDETCTFGFCVPNTHSNSKEKLCV